MREPLWAALMPMAFAKAVPFVMAVFLLLSLSLLAAEVPTSGAGKLDGAASQAPVATETNDSAEIAQNLTNPLAAMISSAIQNWFDFNLGLMGQTKSTPALDGSEIYLSDGTGTSNRPQSENAFMLCSDSEH
jgi:hypothetical protein